MAFVQYNNNNNNNATFITRYSNNKLHKIILAK